MRTPKIFEALSIIDHEFSHRQDPRNPSDARTDPIPSASYPPNGIVESSQPASRLSNKLSTSGIGDAIADAISEAVFKRVERYIIMEQRLFDIDDAAKYLGLSIHALRHKAGIEIPVIRVDTKLRFDRRDLDRYIDAATREGL